MKSSIIPENAASKLWPSIVFDWVNLSFLGCDRMQSLCSTSASQFQSFSPLPTLVLDDYRHCETSHGDDNKRWSCKDCKSNAFDPRAVHWCDFSGSERPWFQIHNVATLCQGIIDDHTYRIYRPTYCGDCSYREWVNVIDWKYSILWFKKWICLLVGPLG